MRDDVVLNKIAIHDYQTLQLPILTGILTHRLGDFRELTEAILGV